MNLYNPKYNKWAKQQIRHGLIKNKRNKQKYQNFSFWQLIPLYEKVKIIHKLLKLSQGDCT